MAEHDVEYSYRDYREEPLSQEEIRATLDLLGMWPREVLRLKDPVAIELGLPGENTDDQLILLLAEHPTLLQRPIAIQEGCAVVARPADVLLVFLGIETE